MKTYIGTKVVKAEYCKAWKEMGNHHLGEDGYKVTYPDGYISWGPKMVFEKAYHELNSKMTFSQALDAMKTGHKVAREGWNGKNQHIEIIDSISYKNHQGEIVNAKHETMGNQAIAFVGTQGIQVGWLASQSDLLSHDWIIVDQE